MFANCILQVTLPDIMEIPNKVQKASKWTTYFLIDLQIVFIITYVYISVNNLISTTANNEATDDTNSMTYFNVTSKFEHTNVEISFIDDAVLWNCRKHSVTKNYYKGLYWMLISAFFATLVAFTAAKLAILCGAKHGKPFLWQIAVMRNLQEEVQDQVSSTKYNIEEANIRALYYKTLLEIDYYKKRDHKLRHNNSIDAYNFFRVMTLFISAICLPLVMWLSFLSYDLHPLSCISEPLEESIRYNKTSEEVHIDFSEGILNYQKVTTGIIIVLGTLLMVNMLCFFCFSYCIVHIFKKQVKSENSELIKSKQQV